MKLQISSSALGVILETFWRKRALGNGTACASAETGFDEGVLETYKTPLMPHEKIIEDHRRLILLYLVGVTNYGESKLFKYARWKELSGKGILFKKPDGLLDYFKIKID